MTKKAQSPDNQQQYMIIGGVVTVAIIAAIIFIVISQNNASKSNIDYSSVLSAEEAENVTDSASEIVIVQERTSDGGYIIGDRDAPFTLVEFADFRCSHCQDYFPTMEQFMEEFVMTGQARFEFRMFPSVDSTGATFATTECAADMYEGGFFPVHDEVFHIVRTTNANSVARDLADEFDLNLDELLRCSRDADQFRTDAGVGQRAGVTGTPGMRMRLNGGALQPLPGVTTGAPSFEVLASLVLQVSLTQ